MSFRTILLSLCLVAVSHASASGLVHHKNLSPIIGQLPQATYPTFSLQQVSSWVYSLDSTTANYLSSGSDGTLNYFIDGETTLVSQSLAYRFDNFLFGMIVPWQSHSNGILDRPIYDFHDFFGMPQNGRTEANIGALNWSLSQNGNSEYILANSSQALGDIELFFESNAIALEQTKLRVSTQLPTGSASSRSSAGSWGISISSLTEQSFSLSKSEDLPSLKTWYGFGANYISDSNEISYIKQHNLVLSSVVGIGVDISNNWGLNAQIDANTPYFDTDIRELGWVPIILSIGSDITIVNNKFNLGFSEDLRPVTSPDFSIYFSWIHYFN